MPPAGGIGNIDGRDPGFFRGRQGRRRAKGLLGDGGIGGFATAAERKRQRSETDAEQDGAAHDGSPEIALYNAAVLSLFTASAMNFA